MSEVGGLAYRFSGVQSSRMKELRRYKSKFLAVGEATVKAKTGLAEFLAAGESCKTKKFPKERERNTKACKYGPQGSKTLIMR